MFDYVEKGIHDFLYILPKFIASFLILSIGVLVSSLLVIISFSFFMPIVKWIAKDNNSYWCNYTKVDSILAISLVLVFYVFPYMLIIPAATNIFRGRLNNILELGYLLTVIPGLFILFLYILQKLRKSCVTLPNKNTEDKT